MTATYGQSTRSSLSGLVVDVNGASVPGARITARHLITGEVFNAATDAQGAFTFPSVPLGQFTVAIEARGFKRAEVLGVQVEVNTPAKLTVAMEVGEVTEAVVVSGAVQEVINTTTPTLTNVINTRQVRDLPLLTRNPLDLARLQAGIAVVGDNTRGASVGGLRGAATNVTQDGINAMDNFVKTSSFFAISAPSLNSTAEFSVTVGTVGSDSGRGVAQVTMVTKSGSNDFHGGVFWQHRNDALNANTFFNNLAGTPRATLRQNFFGGFVGGPLILPRFGQGGKSIYSGRNKSFWFFSYEGFREPFSATRNRTVLTEQARKGIFQYTGANGQLQSVDLLTIGVVNTLNPITGAQLNAMPLPNNTLVGDGLNTAGFRYNVAGSDPNDKYVGRFDQQLLENSAIGSHKLEFVANHATFLLKPDTFNGLEAPFPGGVDAFQSSTRQLYTAAIHSTFGSTMTNEVRVGHQRAPVGFIRDSTPTNYFINLGSTTDYDNTFLSQGRNTLVYQYIDNFSLIKGSHTFKMGTDIQSITAISFNDAGTNQVINLGTNGGNPDGILNSEFPNLPSGSTGTAIANRARTVYRDLVGLLASTTQTFNIVSPTSGFVQGATRKRTFKQREVSLYGQDQWRLRRNMTVNFGVRWEFQGVPFESKGVAIQPVTKLDGLFGISGPNNLFKPGSLKGTSGTVLDFVNGDTGIKLYDNDWNNFAPFIGLAYSPEFSSGPLRWLFGDGRSSIRAGYSISYLHDGFTTVSNALGTGTTNPGLIQTAAVTNPVGVLTGAGIPLATPNFKIPITDVENFAINIGNGLWTFDPKLRVPYVQQWSLGIEREIMPNTAIEIRYVGNHAVKVFRAIDYNEVNIFENGFLNEFLNAQKNLTINGGTSFAPGAAGTVPLPIFSTLFAGLSSSSGFTNSNFINNLQQNNVGTMANTLAYQIPYRANRANLTINGQPAPNFFVANPSAAFARALTNASFSNYNSLQVELRRRMSRGLMFQVNYTLSKAISDGTGNSQSTLESSRTLRQTSLDRTLSDFDQRHRIIGNFIYELPFGNGRRWLNGVPVLSKVAEGWSIGSIMTWQTGVPLFIFSNRTTFNSFNAGGNPAQFTGSSLSDFIRNSGVYKTSSGVFFFNPNMLDITTNSSGQFTGSTLKDGMLDTSAPGQFGNFPINSLRGPSYWQFDFSLSKRTKIYESVEVEFKATFYNAFNHTNFSYGNVQFDSASFGRIAGQQGSPRNINFILGINF